MEVKVAKTAGFCFGVKRAVDKVYELIEAEKVNSVIGATFPLTAQGIYDAHALSETHHAVGKIVIENQDNFISQDAE